MKSEALRATLINIDVHTSAAWWARRSGSRLPRQKGKRSNQQNKYLWSVVYEDYLNGLKARAADVGMVLPFQTKDDLHFHLKAKYVGLPVADFEGEEVHLDPTTTALTTEQFSLYIEAIKAEAADRGIYIREANKDWTYEENAA